MSPTRPRTPGRLAATRPGVGPGPPPTPRAGVDRDRHPRHLRRGAAPVALRRGPHRAPPAALDRPRPAAAVGPRLPRVRDGPGDARPRGPLPGPDQTQRRPPPDRGA